VNYNQLKQALESPSQTRIVDWPEYFHPHRAPDDDILPPTDHNALDALVSRFPVKQRKLMGIVACEMMFPYLAQWVEGAQQRAVVERMDVFQKWQGDTIGQDVFEPVDLLSDEYFGDTMRTPPGVRAICHVQDMIPKRKETKRATFGAVEQSARQIYYARFPSQQRSIFSMAGPPLRPSVTFDQFYVQFLRDWWTRCKTRMPYMNPTGAKLE